MPALYRRLGHFVFRHRKSVLIFWLVALAVAAVTARRSPALLDAGSRPLAGTMSARVETSLGRDFTHPFAQSLAVVFHSPTERFDDPAFQRAAETIAAKLRACPGVARVIVPDESFGRRFRGADGHAIALLVGLGGVSISEAANRVEPVRAAVALAMASTALTGWECQVTGQAAMIHDLNTFNATDSERAEMRALPLTLIVLLLVFGSIVSAALPLALGVASTLLAMSFVPAFVHFAPLNVLYQNVVTLLGLALGIDYSLFMVNRYREERATGERDIGPALAETLATTGVAVTYSSLTVLIGLAGLLFTPLFELRSMGLGGMVVVASSLVLSLTLLPALLAVLTPWLESPRQLASLLRLSGSRQRWERWTSLVLRWPVAALLLGLVILLALSAPLLHIRPGFPDKPWLPEKMETSRGLAALQAMGQGQELTPINLIVRARDGGAVLPDRVDAFFALSERLHGDPRVARVFGPVDLGDDLQEFQLRTLYLNFEQSLETHPEIGSLILSRQHDRALVQVVLNDRVGYADSLAFVRELGTWDIPDMAIEAGGHWSYSNDFDAVVLAAYPVVFGIVIGVTLLVLFFAFRSFLVPVKALVLNALSVTSAFGATVAVFQWGWGASYLGLNGPAGSIPLNIPLIVFCVTFGLSMDYEIFILSRVREEYLRDRDGDGSVRRGLVATGGLISGAAAIMAVVFGAFAFADVVLVKMLGFGLVVAVAVDALIVRAMMVPAAMKLAGRWNWIPGIK